MAASPTPPSISILPPAPLPTDAEAVFDAKAGVRLTAEEVMVTEQNAALSWQAGSMAETKGYMDAAATSAGNAADSAAAAADSATAATNNGAAQVQLAADQVALAAGQVVLAAEQVALAGDQADLAASNGAEQVSLAADQVVLATAQAGSAQAAAVAAGAAAGIPETGTEGDALVRGPGNTVLFESVGKMPRSARTANVQLTTADKGALVDITSGTFTQTFAAAATLGGGWFCYLKNSGTGDITLDPDGSETIDGLTSYIMYPGEARLMQCDGAALQSVVLNTFYKVFTTSGSFVKPPGYVGVDGLLWGAGASGASGGSNNGHASGGAGGLCVPFSLHEHYLVMLNDVVIGSGGASVNGAGLSAGRAGIAGGDSIFVGVKATGGAPGQTGSTTAPLIPETANPLDLGAIRRYTGGTGGAGGNPGSDGGSGVYGGGGGAGANPNLARVGGVSKFGGDGGSANAYNLGIILATAGAAPAGGGGAAGYNNGTLVSYPSGSGARGELRIWGVI